MPTHTPQTAGERTQNGWNTSSKLETALRFYNWTYHPNVKTWTDAPGWRAQCALTIDHESGLVQVFDINRDEYVAAYTIAGIMQWLKERYHATA